MVQGFSVYDGDTLVCVDTKEPHLLFVICRNDADCFYANQEVDPYFADLLDEVKETGIP